MTCNFSPPLMFQMRITVEYSEPTFLSACNVYPRLRYNVHRHNECKTLEVFSVSTRRLFPRKKNGFWLWESILRFLARDFSFRACKSFRFTGSASRGENIVRHFAIPSLLRLHQDEYCECLYRCSSVVAQNVGHLLITLSGVWPRTLTRTAAFSRYASSPRD